MHPDTDKWDLRYRHATQDVAAAEVLRAAAHLLPQSGDALDLACGLGGNALMLAQQGLQTEAWDISAVAIERLQAAASERGLSNLRARVRDVEQQPPAEDSFDVIVVSFFLDRDLCPALAKALRKNGLIFYQTFSQTRVSNNGPANTAFRLADNELLNLFAPLKVLHYRDEGRTGDIRQGFRDQAMLVAQKRES